jgi:hypothetical protein
MTRGVLCEGASRLPSPNLDIQTCHCHRHTQASPSSRLSPPLTPRPPSLYGRLRLYNLPRPPSVYGGLCISVSRLSPPLTPRPPSVYGGLSQYTDTAALRLYSALRADARERAQTFYRTQGHSI